MEKNVAVINDKDVQIVQAGPMEMAQSFLSGGGDLASLEKMLALQEKYEAMQAKKAYTKAIADFKSTPLLIVKDKFNGQFKSKYVSIGNLVNSALPGMGKYGLSHKWDIDQSDPKTIKVTCIVTHSDGHSESVSMSAPPDTSGGNSKNAIQQIKSTITYLRAATFEGIMGLASTDANVDDDGNNSTNNQPQKKVITIGQDNVNWLMGFCNRNKILTPEKKKKLQTDYGFDPHGTTPEEFSEIKSLIELDYKENK